MSLESDIFHTFHEGDSTQLKLQTVHSSEKCDMRGEQWCVQTIALGCAPQKLKHICVCVCVYTEYTTSDALDSH